MGGGSPIPEEAYAGLAPFVRSPPVEAVVFAWGVSEDGQLGLQSTEDVTAPKVVESLLGHRFAGRGRGRSPLVAGSRGSLAVTADGRVLSWGWDARCTLGRGQCDEEFVGREDGAQPGGDGGAFSRGSGRGGGGRGGGGSGNGANSSFGNGAALTGSAGVHRPWASQVAAAELAALAPRGDPLDAFPAAPMRPRFDASPKHVAGLGRSRVVQVALGGWHALARDDCGRAYAWGGNEYGQCGIDSGGRDIAAATRILPRERVMRISAGGMHSLASTVSGELWAFGERWGDDGAGADASATRAPELVVVRADARSRYGVGGMEGGAAATVAASAPDAADPSPASTFVVEISSGAFHNLALTSSGHVFAWGLNEYGQLGTGDTASAPSPVLVPRLPPIASLSAGGWHSLAIDVDGRLYAWGRGEHGRLGTGTSSSASKLVAAPVPDPVAPDDAFEDAPAGEPAGGEPSAGAFAADPPGTTGASPPPSPNSSSRPTSARSSALTRPVWVSASAGGTHSCALDSWGRCWIWGRSSFGRLGLAKPGGRSAHSPQLLRLPGEAARWHGVAVAVGGRHTLLLAVPRGGHEREVVAAEALGRGAGPEFRDDATAPTPRAGAAGHAHTHGRAPSIARQRSRASIGSLSPRRGPASLPPTSPGSRSADSRHAAPSAARSVSFSAPLTDAEALAGVAVAVGDGAASHPSLSDAGTGTGTDADAAPTSPSLVSQASGELSDEERSEGGSGGDAPRSPRSSSPEGEVPMPMLSGPSHHPAGETPHESDGFPDGFGSADYPASDEPRGSSRGASALNHAPLAPASGPAFGSLAEVALAEALASQSIDKGGSAVAGVAGDPAAPSGVGQAEPWSPLDAAPDLARTRAGSLGSSPSRPRTGTASASASAVASPRRQDSRDIRLDADLLALGGDRGAGLGSEAGSSQVGDEGGERDAPFPWQEPGGVEGDSDVEAGWRDLTPNAAAAAAHGLDGLGGSEDGDES